MKLKESKIVDYLDDQLCQHDCAGMEHALESDQDNSTKVDDARLAMQALHELASEEPRHVGEDFWPRVRAQLPAQPPRNAWSQISTTASRWLWPASSSWGISARIALMVAILAMASLWLGPQRTVSPVSAFSASEKAFITRSMQRHEDYVNTPPSVNSLPLPVGDASSMDEGADFVDDTYIP